MPATFLCGIVVGFGLVLFGLVLLLVLLPWGRRLAGPLPLEAYKAAYAVVVVGLGLLALALVAAFIDTILKA
jgi:hypothetical protein